MLVSYDVLGLFDSFVPPFVKQYAQLGQLILSAAMNYANEVRQGAFPQTAAAPHNGTSVLAEHEHKAGSTSQRNSKELSVVNLVEEFTQP